MPPGALACPPLEDRLTGFVLNSTASIPAGDSPLKVPQAFPQLRDPAAAGRDSSQSGSLPP